MIFAQTYKINYELKKKKKKEQNKEEVDGQCRRVACTSFRFPDSASDEDDNNTQTHCSCRCRWFGFDVQVFNLGLTQPWLHLHQPTIKNNLIKHKRNPLLAFFLSFIYYYSLVKRNAVNGNCVCRQQEGLYYKRIKKYFY